MDTSTLFSQALGLVHPWRVSTTELNTAKRRIDFSVEYVGKKSACPACAASDQGFHDHSESRQWRHLDFFQYEAWIHAQIPRVKCRVCGKTTQLAVPWARPNSGFTLLFEALAVDLCKQLTTRAVSDMLRVNDKRIWAVLLHHVDEARKLQKFNDVRTIGIDETSSRKGHEYITVVHDLDNKQLLFATPGKDHQTVVKFAEDFQAHAGKLETIEHVCMDMSGGYKKGVEQEMPQAQIAYDRFHVVALANEAMDETRQAEWRDHPKLVQQAFDQYAVGKKALMKSVRWATRKNSNKWTWMNVQAICAMQAANLKTARAWRLKVALQDVYAKAAQSQDTEVATFALKHWISWARRSRLPSFKRLGATLRDHFEGVINGMLAERHNAYVEAMNGKLQLAKRAARGYRNIRYYITIAYLRMSQLDALPSSPFMLAMPRNKGLTIHRA